MRMQRVFNIYIGEQLLSTEKLNIRLKFFRKCSLRGCYVDDAFFLNVVQCMCDKDISGDPHDIKVAIHSITKQILSTL